MEASEIMTKLPNPRKQEEIIQHHFQESLRLSEMCSSSSDGEEDVLVDLEVLKDVVMTSEYNPNLLTQSSLTCNESLVNKPG